VTDRLSYRALEYVDAVGNRGGIDGLEGPDAAASSKFKYLRDSSLCQIHISSTLRKVFKIFC
jgi:hypothetical protein